MIQGGEVPSETGAGHGRGVMKTGASGGVATHDADEAGALFIDDGVAGAKGGRVTDGAALLEVLPAQGGIAAGGSLGVAVPTGTEAGKENEAWK